MRAVGDENALRSGDIWVRGRASSRTSRTACAAAKFASLKQASELPLAVATDCNRYLNDRLTLLETQLATVNRMATANELPDAIITESGLKSRRSTRRYRHRPSADRPDGNDPAARQDHRTAAGGGRMDGLHSAFAHLKSATRPRQEPVADHDPRRRDRPGPDQMAESCPARPTPSWLGCSTHIRDETYGAALADPVNAQFRHPFAEHWATAPPHRRTAKLPHRQQGREHGHINPNTEQPRQTSTPTF